MIDLLFLIAGWILIAALLLLVIPRKKKRLNLQQRLLAAYLQDVQEIKL